jgi:hypothetical protein
MAAIGDVIGGLFGSGGTQQNQAALIQSLINQANVPKLEDLNMATLGPAAQAGAYADQDFINAQKNALNTTQGQTGAGFTGAELGNLDASGRRIRQSAGDNANRISQQARSRGVGGSGIDMATQAAAGQQAANAMADMGAQAGMGAQNRSLTATQNLGNLGAQGAQQSFGQEFARTGAADTRNQYNNDLSNQNVYYNTVTKPQAQYGMQSGASQGVQGALGSQADFLNQQRQQNMNLVGGLAQAGGMMMM